MITLYGGTALTTAQAQKLAAKLGVPEVSARFVHFVNAENVGDTEAEKLNQLLDYGNKFTAEKSDDYKLVIPRFGTISPWSSKATDIARNAGLGQVKRIERGIIYYINGNSDFDNNLIHDRMTEMVLTSLDQVNKLFEQQPPKQLTEVDILNNGKQAIEKINLELGLALSQDEIDYLYKRFSELKRNPTDVELMMFGVANSEHCRHKIFNASWNIDGKTQDKSLFQMIKNTYEQSSDGVLSAYHDNGAVLAGGEATRFYSDPKTNEYVQTKEQTDIVIKAETHNHPTAISPFAGSGTGSGGEIRDEGATGRGAKPKAGLTGFSVSNLQIPGFEQPWEKPYGKPDRIVSALDIMVEGPLGAAAFNNEFGRTGLTGYFRTFEQEVDGQVRGYHKPIMIGGGIANIRHKDISKATLASGTKLIALGGPAMLIGLGGGAASSQKTGTQDEDLDFASVQRQNPEMQRRAQEVINACWASKDNPILSIHDVGAGGWSNAFPEIIKDAGRGGEFKLRELISADSGLSPMEIWSNEAQERYVLAVAPERVEEFKQICERERCPVAVVGEATEDMHLKVSDQEFSNSPVDIPMDVIFGKPPKLEKIAEKTETKLAKYDLNHISITEALERVLRLPSVASKSFLITIGDRTVGGLNVRDQMVGPWQVPVADVAVTASSYEGVTGEAMAMGERTPLALINAPASGRMAVGELITNMAAARIEKLAEIKLSANWMAASGENSEDYNLFKTVEAIGLDFCPQLGLTIPVGKDSLSMRTEWQEDGQQKSVTAPLSLIISGFAPVSDTSKSLTPQLQNLEATSLVLVDLSGGKKRLGGSALLQVYGQLGDEAPDADAELLKEFFAGVQKLNKDGKILAYHDRSDGGVLTTILEMCFAGRVGAELSLAEDLEDLFNEELGAVLQVKNQDVESVLGNFANAKVIGNVTDEKSIKLGQNVWQTEDLLAVWSETSHQIQRLRDNPQTADQEFENLTQSKPGLSSELTFTVETNLPKLKTKPKVAVLREQGINGQVEMAAAFTKAGFSAVDVHMTDLLNGRQSLTDFVGLAAGGGFSYGDVLGAGGGWAKGILFNEKLKQQFADFFAREETFSLGICNGCQMLSNLKSIIPGAQDWPNFVQNKSLRFEARLVMVEIVDSPSIVFAGMAGSKIPVPTAHGEGLAVGSEQSLTAMRYIDNFGKPTETYPFNPNGSTAGATGFTSEDGRATIMMPHPERAFLSKQFSWAPKEWGIDSPWLQMFINARKFVS